MPATEETSLESNPSALRLAILLRIYEDVETEEEFQTAHKQADELMRTPPEELVELYHRATDAVAAGQDSIDQIPDQDGNHERHGEFLRHARGMDDLEPPKKPLRVPEGEEVNGRPGGEFTSAKALANWYADTYNELTEVGDPVAREEVETANEELEPHDWVVDRKGGQWRAVRIDENMGKSDKPKLTKPLSHARNGQALQYAHVRAPRGFTKEFPFVFKGKPYVGGQYIPSSEIEGASPEEKKKLDQALGRQKKTSEDRKGRWASGGDVDLESLRKLVGKGGKGKPGHTAKVSWKVLGLAHGGHFLNRLQELIELIRNGIQVAESNEEDAHDKASFMDAKESLQDKLSTLEEILTLAETEGQKP